MIAEWILLLIGLAGSSMFVLGLAHVPFGISLFISGVMALFLGSRLRRSRVRFPTLLTALTVVPLIVLALDATFVPLHDFDGRLFWTLKAKALAQERRVDGPFFRGESVHDPRNQYPLLLPLNAAMLLITTRDEQSLRWLYLLIFAAMVFHVRRKLAELVDPKSAAWCAAILAWLPQFGVMEEGGALSAYSDIAVAAFTAAAFFELMEKRSPLRFGLWVAFLVLTKNEGLPIAIVLLILWITSIRRDIGRAAIPFVIALSALLFWRQHVPMTDEEPIVSLLATLPHHLDRLGLALGSFLAHTLAASRWGLLWVAVVGALGLLLWRREWQAPAIVASIVAVYVLVYVITGWNMRDLIENSADRLLMHLIGPALFAIAHVSDSSGRNR